LASRHPMNEAEGRAACVHEARPLLAQLPEGALRLQIENEFAKLVQLTSEELTQMLQAMSAQAPQQAVQTQPAGGFGGATEAGRGATAYHASDEPPGFPGGDYYDGYHDSIPYGNDQVPDDDFGHHAAPVWGDQPASAPRAPKREWRRKGGEK